MPIRLPFPGKLLLLLSSLLLAGAAFAQPLVVVTIHPYFDVARQIGGEHANFVQLLPAGASPHSFDATPRLALQVGQADLLIRNGGAGIDDWLLPLINASGSSAPLLSIMDAVEFTAIGTSAHAHEPEPATATELAEHYVNPHVWLDVTIMMGAAEAIRDALSEIDPANADAYATNTIKLLADLEQLDAELLLALEPVRGAPFVPFHDAWPYFTQRYGLNLILEIEPFPGREPSPAYLQAALAEIAATGARAIFSERQLSPRPAEVVAEAAGLPLYMLDPEGGGAGHAETYQELMRFNACVLLEALAD